MPDLGQYALEVSLAYAGSIAFLAVLVWLSWRQAQASKRRLAEAEKRNDA